MLILGTLLLATMPLACSSGSGGLAGDWIAAFYREAPTGVSATPPGDTGGDTGDTGDTGGGQDTATTVLPACEGDVGAESFRAWVRIDQTNPVQGVHLALYPDGPDEERPAANHGATPSSGMSGLVTGAWTGGVVQLDLVPDLDYAFATDQDRDAWRDHHLQLTSEVWGDRCWTARWAWVATDGSPDPVEQGLVFVRRQ